MQRVVIFQKSDRKLLAALNIERFTDMEVRKIPDVDVILTFETDIFYVKNNEYYVKENVENKFR